MAIGGSSAGPPRAKDGSKGAAGRHAFIAEVARGYLGTLWLARDPASPTSRPVLVRHVAPLVAAGTRAALLEGARWGHAASGVASAEIIEGRTSIELVTDLVDAEPLRALLRTAALKHTDTDPAVLLGLARDLLTLVGVLHDRSRAAKSPHGFGGVHPDSILVGLSGELYLLDVGAGGAASAREPWRSDPQRIGYFAPEQIDLRGVADARTDVFATGILLWEALANRRLFPGNDAKTARERLQRLAIPRLDATRPSATAGIPTPVAELVARALERDPAARFQTVTEMLAAITALECADRARIGVWVTSLADVAIAKRRQMLERSGASIPPPPPAADDEDLTAESLLPTGDLGEGEPVKGASSAAPSPSVPAGAGPQRAVAPSIPPAPAVPRVGMKRPPSIPPSFRPGASPSVAPPRPSPSVAPPRPSPSVAPPRLSPGEPAPSATPAVPSDSADAASSGPVSAAATGAVSDAQSAESAPARPVSSAPPAPNDLPLPPTETTTSVVTSEPSAAPGEAAFREPSDSAESIDVIDEQPRSKPSRSIPPPRSKAPGPPPPPAASSSAPPRRHAEEDALSAPPESLSGPMQPTALATLTAPTPPRGNAQRRGAIAALVVGVGVGGWLIGRTRAAPDASPQGTPVEQGAHMNESARTSTSPSSGTTPEQGAPVASAAVATSSPVAPSAAPAESAAPAPSVSATPAPPEGASKAVGATSESAPGAPVASVATPTTKELAAPTLPDPPAVPTVTAPSVAEPTAPSKPAVPVVASPPVASAKTADTASHPPPSHSKPNSGYKPGGI